MSNQEYTPPVRPVSIREALAWEKSTGKKCNWVSTATGKPVTIGSSTNEPPR